MMSVRQVEQNGTHWYAVSDGAETRRVPGVSAVLSTLADASTPPLFEASAKRERAHVVEHAVQLYAETLRDPLPISDMGFRQELGERIKGAPVLDAFAEYRAAMGTELHRLLHESILGNAVIVQPSETKAFRGFCEKVLPNLSDTYAAERPLVSAEWGFGGTLDWCGYYRTSEAVAQEAVVDWKRTYRIQPKHLLQVSGYRELAIENGLVSRNALAIIVRVGDDGEIEVRIRTAEEAAADFMAFTALLGMHGWYDAMTRPPVPTPAPTVAPVAINPKAPFSFASRRKAAAA